MFSLLLVNLGPSQQVEKLTVMHRIIADYCTFQNKTQGPSFNTQCDNRKKTWSSGCPRITSLNGHEKYKSKMYQNNNIKGTSQVAQWVKNLPAMLEIQETQVRFLGQEDPLEEDMATHSSILAWRIPWTEKPSGNSPQGHKESEVTERTYKHIINSLLCSTLQFASCLHAHDYFPKYLVSYLRS